MRKSSKKTFWFVATVGLATKLVMHKEQSIVLNNLLEPTSERKLTTAESSQTSEMLTGSIL